jgi:hypothetical protein
MKRKTRKSSKRLRQSKRKTLRRFFHRYFKGGANLPVPVGSVVGVHLDPKDNYSVPVFMTKAQFENEIL